MQNENTVKRSIAMGISLPADLVTKIDAERGDIPRSRYLLRILERVYCSTHDIAVKTKSVTKSQNRGSKQKEGSKNV